MAPKCSNTIHAHGVTRSQPATADWDTVALSGGTTTTEVARNLKLLSGITILTNTVNVAMELSSCKGIDVVVTGGQLRGNWFTLVGPLANHAAQSMFADIMFIGVDGIDPKQGLTCVHPSEANCCTRYCIIPSGE